MTLQTLFGAGVEPKDLTFLHVTMRTLVLFFSALVMIRVADKRFLAGKTGFDALVGFLLASTLSRAINGTAPLPETIAVGFLVVFLHRGLSKLAAHNETFCHLIKGRSEQVIANGKLDHQVMSRNDLTEGDLMEDMRLKAQIDDFAKVRDARIERNGEISVIPDKEKS
jgi:uncharacterized membrane protein YcaP (DUF421 family)